ncbi:MAG: hypothetical protein RR620_01950 [Clostridium sp.]
MAKCQCCSYEFKLKDVIKSIFLLNKPIKCDECKVENYVKLKSVIFFLGLMLIPLVLITTLNSIFGLVITIVLYSIWYIKIVCLLPFLIKYYRKDSKKNDVN